MYALQNCSSTTLRIFTTVGILEFVQRITPKGNIKCFRQGLLNNDECVVVGKVFNKVVEERTKFKQIKRQLKALGFDNEYACQMADALNNACWVFDHFEKIQGNLRVCPSIDICGLFGLVLNDGRELQSKEKEAQTAALR